MNFSLSGRKKIAIAAIGTGLVLFGSGFYAGYKTQPSANNFLGILNKQPAFEVNGDMAPFWKAWSVLEDKFVSASSTDDQSKIWGAIQGLASSYKDPYTVFFPPAESKIFEGDIEGNFSGVGMEIGIKDKILTVISALNGTPAFLAGVKAGDKVVKIDGKNALDMSVEEAVNLIRGEKGTKVTITFAREGVNAPIVKELTRDTINVPALDTEKKNGVFVIKVYNFSANAPDMFRNALREFISSGYDKLILDLRGNPGGYLDAAIDMSSWFLPPGKVIVKENYGGKKAEDIFRSKGYGNGKYGIFNDRLKMAVLVNEGSASASEIMAGALKEQKVATIVGAKTFGKGSVQELVPITSDTSLKVTIAKWLTPNGLSISDNGLEPDVKVDDPTDKEVTAGKDPQLEKAIQILQTKGL